MKKRVLITLAMVLLCGSVPALAQSKKSPTRPSGGLEGESKRVKVKVIERDGKKVKYAEKTDVNFEDALIEGAAKSPFSTMIGSRDQEFNRGFIKIRYEWHDQLIMSVSGLSQ